MPSQSGEPGGVKRSRPTVYDWVGEFVVVTYTSGPSWREVDNPFDVARGALEGREGVFLLQEVSNLGVLLRQPTRDEGFLRPFFVPWGSVHIMAKLEFEDETEEEQEQQEET